jgi:hypothetical protein
VQRTEKERSMSQPSRREFAARAVAAAGSLAAGAVAPSAEAPKRKSKIGIGVRFNAAWLNSKNDEDLKFFKQLGVDAMDIELTFITPEKQTCYFSFQF